MISSSTGWLLICKVKDGNTYELIQVCVVLFFLFRRAEQGSVFVLQRLVAEFVRHSIAVNLEEHLILFCSEEPDLDFDKVFETL